jgi:serine/threonine protein kinase
MILIASHILTPQQLKLCDFGEVHVADDMNVKDKFTAVIDVGSFNYMAPEVARETAKGAVRGADGKLRAEYNAKCDLWSAGALLLVLLTRKLIDQNFPRKGTQQEHVRHLKNATLEPPSAEMMDLFAKIFVDVDDRISLEEIKEHPWFKYGATPSDHDFACELFRRNGAKMLDSINIAPTAMLAESGSAFYAAAVGSLCGATNKTVWDMLVKLGIPEYKEMLRGEGGLGAMDFDTINDVCDERDD